MHSKLIGQLLYIFFNLVMIDSKRKSGLEFFILKFY
jgi:hypothetical protein